MNSEELQALKDILGWKNNPSPEFLTKAIMDILDHLIKIERQKENESNAIIKYKEIVD